MLADLHYPTELDTISYDDLIKDLEAQYGTKSSRSAARVQLARVSQHEGQTIDEFLAELRKASQECEFGGQLEDRLRDQLLVGIRSDAIRKRLLEHELDSLSDVTKRARDMELIERDNKMTLTHTPVNRVGYHSSNASEETTYQANRNKLLDLDVIEKVDIAEYSTTPIVPVRKPNGQIRICGDFKVTVNRYIDVQQYPLPHVEEATRRSQFHKTRST